MNDMNPATPGVCVRPARRRINQIGYATLIRFLFGLAAGYGAYLLVWAALGSPHILVVKNGFIDLHATTVKLKASCSGVTLLYPLLLLFTTIFVNLLPFMGCAKKLGLSMRGFFAKPRVSAGTVAIFGFVAFGANMAIAFVVNMLNLILKLMGIRMTTPDLSLPLHSPGGSAVMILAVVVAGPIAEEFIFRGVMLRAFKQYGSLFAVICSSLLWAMMHGNLIQAVPVFGIGLVLGLLALKADSIVPTMVIHMANNLLALFGMLARQSGSMALVFVVAGVNLTLFFTAIPLGCVYCRRFMLPAGPGEGAARQHIGPRAFSTSWPVLLSLLIYAYYIVTSVIPSGFTM